jgi:hypothetical protein
MDQLSSVEFQFASNYFASTNPRLAQKYRLIKDYALFRLVFLSLASNRQWYKSGLLKTHFGAEFDVRQKPPSNQLFRHSVFLILWLPSRHSNP